MITKIYFPVPVMNDGDFEYNGPLSDDELDITLMDKLKERNNHLMGGGAFDPYSGLEHDERHVEGDRMVELEAQVLGYQSKPLSKEDFERFLTSGQMKVLELNINPDTDDYDVISELRFWIGDSVKVLEDSAITDSKVKVNALPVRDLDVEAFGERYHFKGCRMINQLRGKYPLHIVMMASAVHK